MDLNSLKIKVAEKVLTINDKSFIQQLEALVDAYEDDLWDELTDKQQETVLLGRKQIKEGNGMTTNEVMSKYKKWLTK